MKEPKPSDPRHIAPKLKSIGPPRKRLADVKPPKMDDVLCKLGLKDKKDCHEPVS